MMQELIAIERGGVFCRDGGVSVVKSELTGYCQRSFKV